MDTLRLVEVAGDGALVLMTGDGRRFSLSVDEQVRSAVRRSRNGTQTAPDSDRPGPREVQARIRAGADAEQVALQTGLEVDYVRRFEGPVLAERAHVADLARGTAVDRGGDPTLTLERIVLDVLTGEGYDVDDIAWDSRRSDGNRWQVVVVSSVGTARTEATWTFDTATRSLEPVDAEAERLTGVERRRRLSAVRETVFDVERPAATAVRGGTVELLDALARQRGRRPAPREDVAPQQEPTGTDQPRAQAQDGDRTQEGAQVGGDGRAEDEGEEQDVVRAPAAEPSAGGEEPAGSSGVPSHGSGTGSASEQADQAGTGEPRPLRGRPGPASDLDEDRPSSDAGLSIEPDLLSELDLDGAADPRAGASRTASAPPSAPPKPSPTTPSPAAVGDRRARRRRAAVPSWDEIVFGAKREDA